MNSKAAIEDRTLTELDRTMFRAVLPDSSKMRPYKVRTGTILLGVNNAALYAYALASIVPRPFERSDVRRIVHGGDVIISRRLSLSCVILRATSEAQNSTRRKVKRGL